MVLPLVQFCSLILLIRERSDLQKPFFSLCIIFLSCFVLMMSTILQRKLVDRTFEKKKKTLGHFSFLLAFSHVYSSPLLAHFYWSFLQALLYSLKTHAHLILCWLSYLPIVCLLSSPFSFLLLVLSSNWPSWPNFWFEVKLNTRALFLAHSLPYF